MEGPDQKNNCGKQRREIKRERRSPGWCGKCAHLGRSLLKRNLFRNKTAPELDFSHQNQQFLGLQDSSQGAGEHGASPFPTSALSESLGSLHSGQEGCGGTRFGGPWQQKGALCSSPTEQNGGEGPAHPQVGGKEAGPGSPQSPSLSWLSRSPPRSLFSLSQELLRADVP